MSKKPWTPADIALAGLSSLACAVIFAAVYVLFKGPLDADLGPAGTVLIVLTWVTLAVGVLALAAAGIAKVIGVGVRSASD